MGSTIELPDAKSPDLHLSHPTPEECITIWTHTSASWKDSLTLPLYLIESQFLTTIPLARDGGMTTWILVDKNLPPNQRQILCSCESYRKRSLTSNAEGDAEENLIHGLASVFCPADYRGRGYAARLMVELATVLRQWQPAYGKSIGSVLYSDIGKMYYAQFGWLPNATNTHFVFSPAQREKPAGVQQILESELEGLCLKDEATIRAALAAPSPARKRVTILPNLDHMLWHIRKEDFATQHIFGSVPKAKGAIAGNAGKQVWALWVHRYYDHPDHPGEEGSSNVLHILRLVIEGDSTANKPLTGQVPSTDAYAEQAIALKAVLQAAQAEAAEWRLDQIQVWEPSPLAQSLIVRSGLDAVHVERQEENIACALWFDDANGDASEAPFWINNEYYAWC